MKWLLNHCLDVPQYERSLAAADALGAETATRVRALLSRCPGYEPTPIHELDTLAIDMGVAGIVAKDERFRLHMGSFKALGGAYAVLVLAAKLASQQLGRCVDVEELLEKRVEAAPRLTVTTATAGNHGRSVAAGAALIGARSVIFVYDGVPHDQVAAIARHGAQIEYVNGVYEEAVRVCRERAAVEGWHVVSDTSWEGYEETPINVMAGYTAMASELLEQTAEARPTHVFLQAGVGGMAAAIAGHLAQCLGPNRPRMIVVEPEAAACLLESARHGKLMTVPATERTAMGRLECYSPSPVAWRVLEGIADAFVAVPDSETFDAQDKLARLGITTSPSGCAGLAGLAAVMRSPEARQALRLDSQSRALVLITEEATYDDLIRINATPTPTPGSSHA